MWVTGLIIGLLAGTAAGLWPKMKKMKRKRAVAHTTEFPSLKYARMLASGEMTVEEYAKLTEKDLEPVVRENTD